jgi:AraC-like DNA-binding protein
VERIVTCRACGFSDQSAFTRCFRTAVGMSPRAFRKTIFSRGAAAGL